jgi:predicted FMN-binding regulatory protein PaiB
MLVRAEYAMPSMAEVRRPIQDHGWAVLVVGSPGDPRAAHVPCRLDPVHDPGGAAARLVIIGPAARADPVGSALRAGQPVLVVFQGPNGYVSPAWYGEGPSVPTWNFSAGHVGGIPQVLDGRGGVLGAGADGGARRGRPGTTRGSWAGRRWPVRGGSLARRCAFGSGRWRSRPRRS